MHRVGAPGSARGHPGWIRGGQTNAYRQLYILANSPSVFLTAKRTASRISAAVVSHVRTQPNAVALLVGEAHPRWETPIQVCSPEVETKRCHFASLACRMRGQQPTDCLKCDDRRRQRHWPLPVTLKLDRRDSASRPSLRVSDPTAELQS